MVLEVVVPCKNEEDCIELFLAEIEELRATCVKSLDIRCLFVDDGSTDNTINLLRRLHRKKSYVRYVKLTKNFGKEAALLAGLKNSIGDLVAIIDVDGQDDVSLLPMMCEHLALSDYDVVALKGEHALKVCSKIFYKIFNKVADYDLPANPRDCRVIRSEALECFLSNCTSGIRFLKGDFEKLGLKTDWITVPIKNRMYGKTKWSITSYLRYAMDALMLQPGFSRKVLAVIGTLLVGNSVLKCVRGKKFEKTQIINHLSIGTLLGLCLQYLSFCFRELLREPIYVIDEIDGKKLNKYIVERSGK